jgi:2-succinyl-6-hydroxy-2,4-cyclohexadiene-1-carboxylate synthase
VIQHTKQTDERREAGPTECWCLHGAVGLAADWRGFAKNLAASGIGSRAVDLWRFLDCCPLPIADFGKTLNAEASGQVFRGNQRALLGYSMGGRLALHSLLEPDHPWQAAIIISADPGLESEAARAARRASDAEWASQALTGTWTDFLTAWDAQAIFATSAPRDPATANSLIMRRREIARSFVDWSLGAQQPLWDRLKEITIPVLWIVGEQDEKFHALAQRAVSLLPDATLAIAPGTGHRVPSSATDWLANTVGHFLKK